MLELFLTFLKIGLFTFGGGYAMIPLISEEIAKFNIDPYTFSDFIAISESTPGPFAINIATFIGYDSFGFLGALIATLGVIIPSYIIMLLIVIFINKVRKTRFFKTFITISTPIILGLILSSIIKLSSLNLFNISDFSNIKSQISINNLTLITLAILSLTILIYYLIKKKKLSPFIVIILSFGIGSLAYFFNFI